MDRSHQGGPSRSSLVSLPLGYARSSGGNAPQHSGQDQQVQGGGSPQHQTQHQQPVRHIRRRMRMITSCLECRRRKLRCSKSQPCSNCKKFGLRECVYLGPQLDEASQLWLTEIKEKVGSLELQLERVVSDAATGSAGPSRQLQYRPSPVRQSIIDEVDQPDLELTPLASLDLTYDYDADGVDDLFDLGVRIGKMRLTERVGGLSRTRLSEEISAALAYSPPQGTSPAGPVLPDASGSMGMPQGMESWQDSTDSESAVPDFMRPGESYIAPTSGFVLGQILHTPSILTYLPTRAATDRLLRQYLRAVHPVAPCVHMPSFMSTYHAFWDDVDVLMEPRPSVQAVVMAALFSASVSMDDATVSRDFGLAKANLIEGLKTGVEAALSKANFLRTTNVETLQAFVMYMIPLCREEVSRAHSILVGAAIRMAQCMGLHRDGEHYGLAPLETHVRRLIWHQLCFLDIRTCEVQGPHPGIRREEYDTKMPLAVDDGSLVGAAVAPELPGRWTPMLLPVIRFEINEMMRNIWADRRRLEARRTTLPAVLTKIEEFRHRLFAKYEPILADDSEDDDDGDDDDDENCNDDDGDNDETRQAGLLRQYTRLVMHLLASRLHVMVLHAYYVNSPKALPPKAASVLIMSAVLIIEVAARLETDPRFARWAWYLGAYTQYHAALLLATEAYYRSVADADDPDAATTDRIWACLDHVFGLDPAAPRDVKGRILLGDIMTRTAAYHRLRRSRGPTAVQAAVPSMNAIGTAFSATSCRISSYSGDGQHQQQPHQKQQHQQQSKGSPAVVSIRLHSTPSDTGHSTADVASGHQSCYHYQQQPRQKMPPPPSMPLGGVQGQQSSMMQMPIPMPMEVSPGDPAGGAGGSSLPQELESVDWLSDMLRETSGRQEGSDAHRVSVPTAQEMFDALFPINPSTGQLDLPGYHDPNLGMRWQTWTGV